VSTVDKLSKLLAACQLISLATTAAQPYIDDISMCRQSTTILHLSLRDLAPEVVLECDNVVDDADQVCSERTSIHLAELTTGHRSFIRCEIGELLQGIAPPRGDADVSVFSPFGLGVLDITLAEAVYQWAVRFGRGNRLQWFAGEDHSSANARIS
jgi:ornithine cyclodeaminase/alanine dehydrogenase-like protein (mu-crystallin family)